MITINTINHSWYFIKETVIKPNASLTYDETLLNKSETKDLLESVSSKRVSLSSEDLIKVQNRYNSFNPGGNVDLSQVISKIEEIYKDDGGGVRSGVLVEEIDERVQADLDLTEAIEQKASLGLDGKILEAQLPDAIKDVLVYPSYLDFPTVNQPLEKILIDSSLNKMYYWNGTAYVPLPANSDSISEGVSNLYFTPARAQAAVINIQGNSATSSRLQVPVAIELTGGVFSNPVYFDGSSDISIEAYPILEDSGVYPGIYNNSTTEITPLIIDSKGRVIWTDTPITISPDWSSINSPPNTIYGYGITDAYTKDEVDTAISGISGTGGAIPRPKFAGGTKRYLTGVWHDYSFGWVPTSGGYANATIGGGRSWLYPFIPLDNCVVSALGICTGSNFAGNIKLGFYDSNSAAKPNNKLFGSSLINTAVTNTVLSASTGGISVTAGNLYWIALFSQDGGNPSLVHCNQNLFPMVSNGSANTSTSNLFGYMLNADGFNTQTDLPTFPAAEPFMSYAGGTTAPRLVFKISS